MGLATNAMFLVGLIIDVVPVGSEVLLLGLLALVILAASVRAFMLGASYGPKGVMIRSFVMSQRIPWSDIVEVGVISESAGPGQGTPVGHFPTITYLNQFRFKKQVVLWSLGASEPVLAQQRAATIRELAAVHSGRAGEPVAEPS
jgi:hypothetical protein